MVTVLRELFAKSRHPSHEDKEATVQALVAILEQAQAIGHAHASDELERRIAWGGAFGNLLASAWDIVNNFVQRIGDWINGQESEGDAPSEDDIAGQIGTLAETVASVEVPSAVEGAVMDELQSQGVLTIRWIAQPGACKHCQANADMGSVPIGTDFNGDTFPPAHANCRCSLGTGDGE